MMVGDISQFQDLFGGGFACPSEVKLSSVEAKHGPMFHFHECLKNSVESCNKTLLQSK